MCFQSRAQLRYYVFVSLMERKKKSGVLPNSYNKKQTNSCTEKHLFYIESRFSSSNFVLPLSHLKSCCDRLFQSQIYLGHQIAVHLERLKAGKSHEWRAHRRAAELIIFLCPEHL